MTQSANKPAENLANAIVNVRLPRSIKLNSIFSSNKKSENASIGDSTLVTSSTSVFGLSAEKANCTSRAKLNRSEMWNGLSASGDTDDAFVSGRLITFGSAIATCIQTWAVNFEQYGSAATAVGKAQLE